MHVLSNHFQIIQIPPSINRLWLMKLSGYPEMLLYYKLICNPLKCYKPAELLLLCSRMQGTETMPTGRYKSVILPFMIYFCLRDDANGSLFVSWPIGLLNFSQNEVLQSHLVAAIRRKRIPRERYDQGKPNSYTEKQVFRDSSKRYKHSLFTILFI